MDLRLIEIFHAVMQHRSATEAARALGVSQPAVQRGLKRLETNVGFVLFRRESRHIVPTPEAHLLHNEAMHALAGFAELEDTAAGISAGKRGVLTVASSPSPGIALASRRCQPLPAGAAVNKDQAPDPQFRKCAQPGFRHARSTSASRSRLSTAPTCVLRRYRFRWIA